MDLNKFYKFKIFNILILSLISLLLYFGFTNGIHHILFAKFNERSSNLSQGIPIRLITFTLIFLIFVTSSKSFRNKLKEISIISNTLAIISFLTSLISYGISRIFIFINIYYLFLFSEYSSSSRGVTRSILFTFCIFSNTYWFLNYSVEPN